MAPIADDDLHGYYPVPFPDGLPTISLAKLSVQKLLKGDEEAAQTLFRVCCGEGFFYLDLTTHPRGQQFLDDSNKLHNIAKDVFNSVTMEEKLAFKTGDPLKDHLDTGYKCVSTDEEGDPDKAEFVNISTYKLLNETEAYTKTLPAWLRDHTELYRSFMENGNALGQIILTVLERELHLQPGELTNIHKLNEMSGEFLRMFRYPAPKSGKPLEVPPAPAHTDATSITMLFNWQGGLQITKPKQPVPGRVDRVDRSLETDDWHYVKPEPGHVIVNLGDPMVVFTNGVLKSGRHQVVTPPGPQSLFHRYSVLTNLRPSNDTLIRPLKSDIIPEATNAQDADSLTALAWSLEKVKSILERMSKGVK